MEASRSIRVCQHRFRYGRRFYSPVLLSVMALGFGQEHGDSWVRLQARAWSPNFYNCLVTTRDLNSVVYWGSASFPDVSTWLLINWRSWLSADAEKLSIIRYFNLMYGSSKSACMIKSLQQATASVSSDMITRCALVFLIGDTRRFERRLNLDEPYHWVLYQKWWNFGNSVWVNARDSLSYEREAMIWCRYSSHPLIVLFYRH